MNDRDIRRLTKALTPFIGARQRNEPRTTGASISVPGATYHDANIRGVGPEGITIFWYGSGEVMPWADVRRVETFEIGRRYGQPIRCRQRYAT